MATFRISSRLVNPCCASSDFSVTRKKQHWQRQSNIEHDQGELPLLSANNDHHITLYTEIKHHIYRALNAENSPIIWLHN